MVIMTQQLFLVDQYFLHCIFFIKSVKLRSLLVFSKSRPKGWHSGQGNIFFITLESEGIKRILGYRYADQEKLLSMLTFFLHKKVISIIDCKIIVKTIFLPQKVSQAGSIKMKIGIVLKLKFKLLGDPEVTANFYCNFAYPYQEGCMICSIYLR